MEGGTLKDYIGAGGLSIDPLGYAADPEPLLNSIGLLIQSTR